MMQYYSLNEVEGTQPVRMNDEGNHNVYFTLSVKTNEELWLFILIHLTECNMGLGLICLRQGVV